MRKTLLFFTLACLLSFHSIVHSSVWQREAADSTGTDKGEYCSLALDSQDNPHIAYYDTDFEDLRYAYFDGNNWAVEIVDSIGNAGIYCSIALDSQDRPHVSYQQEYLGYYWSLKYATPSDTGWIKEIVDSPQDTSIGQIGEFSSIAINDDGYPCISYLQADPDEIKYAFQDSTGWNITVVNQVNIPRYSKLAFSETFNPIIGYHRLDTLNNEILEIAYFDPSDTSWDVVQVPDNIGGISFGDLLSFDIDNQDNAYFVYFDSNDSLSLAIYNGVSWTIEKIMDNTGFSGRPGFDLKIDHLNQPGLVTFQDGIYFHRKISGVWESELVDDQIVPGWYCSLQFDNENHPRISSYCRTLDYSRDALFYYRYWPGDPEMVLPDTTYNFGVVWTQSYLDWECSVDNNGEAPLIINELEFTSVWYDTTFRLMNVSLPHTIMPYESDSITIRFDPDDNLTYFDTLIIYSNDPVNPEARISLQGTGTTSGDFGSLIVDAKNSYAALEYHVLNEPPISGAAISLYQNNQLMYGPSETGSGGSVQFDNVAVGDYDLIAEKEVTIPGDPPLSTNLKHTTPVSIGPGTNTADIVLPESLVVQKYQSIYNLTHIAREGPLGDTVYIFSYPSEEEVRQLLDTWLSDLDLDVKLSIARLLLAERLTHQMFDSGFSIGDALLDCIGELINFIFFSDSWVDQLADLVGFLIDLFTDPVSAILDILNTFAKLFILELMDDAIQQVASELPCILDENSNQILCGETVVMVAWGEIKDRYSGWERLFPGFSDQSWAETERWIHRTLRGPIFQVVYVDILTDDQIENAKNYSENFNFSGDFRDASEYSAWFISDKTAEVETDVDVCHDLIVTARLFEATSTILNLIGNFVPGLGWLSSIGTAMEIAAYIEVVAGIGISGYTFFTLPDEMENAVDRIYHPDGLLQERQNICYPWPRAKMDPSLIAYLKTSLQQSSDEFDSTLSEIGNLIQSGNYEDALLGLEGLMDAESDFRNDLNVSCAPVYALANIARDSLSGFQPVYDSLKTEYSRSGMERFKDLFYIAFSPMDSSQEMIDSISVQINRSISQNQTLVNRIGEALDTVSVLDMPAIVTVKEANQNLYNLGQGQIATIQLSLINPGALTAENVSLVMSTNGAISINEADSIYIGTILPGEETGAFTWTVNLASNDYSRGVWTANINSSNARTFPYSGSFVTPKISTPSTGGRLSSDYVYCYPNPFNPDVEQTTLRYSLEKTSEVTIKIYDAGGNLVITLMDDVQQPAASELSIGWDGRNGEGDMVSNGVYFFIIETSENERAVGKIAVLR